VNSTISLGSWGETGGLIASPLLVRRCPFGALQELVVEATERQRVPD
jgi:hypothetical protein